MKLDNFINPVKALFSGEINKKLDRLSEGVVTKIAAKSALVAFAVGIFAGAVTGSVIVFAVMTPIALLAAGTYNVYHTNVLFSNAKEAGESLLDGVKNIFS